MAEQTQPRGGSPIGFANYRPPGFASYLESSGAKTFQIPQPGFAAALREGQAEQERAAKDASRRQTRQNKRAARAALEELDPPIIEIPPESGQRTDSPKGKAQRFHTAHRSLGAISFVIGQRFDTAARGSGWSNFVKKLKPQIDEPLEVIEARKYFLPFFTDRESEIMLTSYANSHKPRAGSTTRDSARKLIGRIEDELHCLAAEEIAITDNLFAEDSDLAQIYLERRADPDNPKWFAYDASNAREEKAQALALWQPSMLTVKGIGNSAITKVSLELADDHGELQARRSRIIKILHQFGLETGHISAQWTGYVDIMQTTGGEPVDGLSYRIPSYPLQIPLKPTSIWETSQKDVL